jgi:Domain related to MnhB subunit of Na+/H+ antiporter.
MSQIIKTISRMLIPFIFVYAIWLILTGHTSPGGAFAGGVTASLAVALAYVSFGISPTKERFSYSIAHMGRILGLMGFIMMGVIAMLLGKGFLGNFLPKFGGHFTMAGVIIVLNLCIGILVGCEFSLLLYYLFGGGGKE